MGHYREILPKMTSVTRNCPLTNKLAIAISEKLDPEEFRMFQEWLKLVEVENQSKVNNVKRFNQFWIHNY